MTNALPLTVNPRLRTICPRQGRVCLTQEPTTSLSSFSLAYVFRHFKWHIGMFLGGPRMSWHAIRSDFYFPRPGRDGLTLALHRRTDTISPRDTAGYESRMLSFLFSTSLFGIYRDVGNPNSFYDGLRMLCCQLTPLKIPYQPSKERPTLTVAGVSCRAPIRALVVSQTPRNSPISRANSVNSVEEFLLA